MTENERLDYIKKFKVAIRPRSPWQKVNEKYDLDLAIWIQQRTLYIMFQGSSSKIDWKLNLSFWKKPYKDMTEKIYVHSGQITGYKSARDFIHNYFLEHKKEIDNVHIGGHSLGDSYARFCYMDFFWHKENKTDYHRLNLSGLGGGGNKNVSWIGHKEANRRLEGYVRLQNGNDIVPRIPPIFYKQTGKQVIINKPSWWSYFLLLPSHFYHHNPSSYLGYLKDPKTFKDTEENNYTLPIAKKWLKRFYFGVFFLIVFGVIIAKVRW